MVCALEPACKHGSIETGRLVSGVVSWTATVHVLANARLKLDARTVAVPSSRGIQPQPSVQQKSVPSSHGLVMGTSWVERQDASWLHHAVEPIMSHNTNVPITRPREGRESANWQAECEHAAVSCASPCCCSILSRSLLLQSPSLVLLLLPPPPGRWLPRSSHRLQSWCC